MEKIYNLVDRKRYPCPVCNAVFKRDRLMVLGESDEGKKYICQSEIWEDISCGFIFPEGLDEKEIKKLAIERIKALKEKM